MNPSCTVECSWADDDLGRAPKFCSDVCRMAFSRERAKLQEEIAAYEAAGKQGSSTYKQRAQIERRVSTLRMLLVRYPAA